MTQYTSALLNARLFLNSTASLSVLSPHLTSATGTLVLLSHSSFRHVDQVASPIAGVLTLHGDARLYANQPYGAFGDFSSFAAGAEDPAMVLVHSHNGGQPINDATTPSDYRRFDVMLSAPADYLVSGGKNVWSRAAYASIGLKIKNMAYNNYAYIAGAQMEVANFGATGPVPYESARAINCLVYTDDTGSTLNNESLLITELLNENTPLGVTPQPLTFATIPV